jgi:hypothetical protein
LNGGRSPHLNTGRGAATLAAFVARLHFLAIVIEAIQVVLFVDFSFRDPGRTK